MKKSIIALGLTIILPSVGFSQDNGFTKDILFDPSAPTAADEQKQNLNTEENISDAVDSARNLLNQKPIKLRQQKFPEFKSRALSASSTTAPTQELDSAPFGLYWASTMDNTRNQGVTLTPVEMEDYANSFLAGNLPKAIDFFERVYVTYGEENKLYRILAYSKLIDDDASASKVLKEYNTYSEYLNKKYGNKQEDFTPAVISKTITNAQGKEETVTENAPIGNPEFLSQLLSGDAVLFSTYYNDDIAAALSIGVDGDKKTYIVIDYKNLEILKKQEAETLDAL